MSGKVDSPGECAGSDQDLDLLVAEKLLDQSGHVQPLFGLVVCSQAADEVGAVTRV